MNKSPAFTQWSEVLTLIERSNHDQSLEHLLSMLMTADERDSMKARVNIIYELLKGELNQRQISQLLGVGIATVTRGSNEVKQLTDYEKSTLFQLLESIQTADRIEPK